MLLKSSPDQLAFQQGGFAACEFFPHRAALIRKQYPDTYLLLEGRGLTPSELMSCQFWQLNLYSEDIAGFPDALFTDRAVNWHNQQLGVKGLIAAAAMPGGFRSAGDSSSIGSLPATLPASGAQKEECKTQVDKRFGAWYRFLLNAILDLARDLKASAVYVPTADWILRATKRFVYPELFRRIYDLASSYAAGRIRRGSADYWEIGLSMNAQRIVPMVAMTPETERDERLILHLSRHGRKCRHHGYVEECRESLTQMLRREQQPGAHHLYSCGTDIGREARRENPLRQGTRWGFTLTITRTRSMISFYAAAKWICRCAATGRRNPYDTGTDRLQPFLLQL